MNTSLMIQPAALWSRYHSVRRVTESLCAPLQPDDFMLQSMTEASPFKWHLAHTSWFFETFVLEPHLPGYRPFSQQFNYIFNSYYEAIGERWPRPQRSLIARPTTDEVIEYRHYVDEQLARLVQNHPTNNGDVHPQAALIELGLQHEQQHQELMITDLKHAWAQHPLPPEYVPWRYAVGEHRSAKWVSFDGGLVEIGHDGTGFCFDNETPRHRVYAEPFQVASNLVRNADYVAFIEDGGYRRAELWLSDGWATVQRENWTMPLYWRRSGRDYEQVTMSGLVPLEPAEPVSHVSFYEADAFARWTGARLPTETEWEMAANAVTREGHFQEAGRFHPASGPADADDGPIYQMFGDVWQWTGSPYVAYPDYRPEAGVIGEYNGKFMCNQMVLRGASCATPRSHARSTYRNFFSPDARWQFAGIRLARST